jgi:hypothetical protein
LAVEESWKSDSAAYSTTAWFRICTDELNSPVRYQ